MSLQLEDITITVRKPDVNHFHWGVEVREKDHLNRGGKPIEDCHRLNQMIERAAKGLDWGPFHQGGHHDWDQRCGGWHYWEFWGLSGSGDYELVVTAFIETLKQGIQEDLT